MVSIIKIHHVAMVVEDIERSLIFWRDGLGLNLDHVRQIPEQEAVIAFLPVGEGEIELVQPLGKNSGLARYLAKKGAGIHHLCIQVDQITPMLFDLKQKGFRLINEMPMQEENGKKYAFIHPESTGGVLVELYELPKQNNESE
jgi:methylmalonyl-CoA/ethylmalonyl-CoA epimerase